MLKQSMKRQGHQQIEGKTNKIRMNQREKEKEKEKKTENKNRGGDRGRDRGENGEEIGEKSEWDQSKIQNPKTKNQRMGKQKR